MINRDNGVLEDSTKAVNASAVIYRGVPVALNSSGEVIAATNTSIPYGLATLNKNSYRDDTFGNFAAFGSGKMGVAKRGMVTVGPETFDTATGTTDIFVFDVTRTYAVSDRLFANASGLISNDSTLAAYEAVNGVSVLYNCLGRVSKVPSASAWEMEIDLLVL